MGVKKKKKKRTYFPQATKQLSIINMTKYINVNGAVFVT